MLVADVQNDIQPQKERPGHTLRDLCKSKWQSKFKVFGDNPLLLRGVCYEQIELKSVTLYSLVFELTSPQHNNI